MKKATVFIAVFLYLFAFAPMSFADDVKEAEKPKVRQITGQVISLNAEKGTLTIKNKRQEVALETDEETNIRIGKEKKELVNLKKGDNVKAKYIQVDGKNRAKSISIMTSTDEAMK